MNNDNSIPEPYAILMMNDTLGHEAGDQMIFQLSNILRNTLFLSTQHGKSVNSFRGWPICFSCHNGAAVTTIAGQLGHANATTTANFASNEQTISNSMISISQWNRIVPLNST